MDKKELKEFLKKFKEVSPKKESEQTKFDLDLHLKKKIDDSKIGYKIKGLSKYKRFEINQKNSTETSNRSKRLNFAGFLMHISTLIFSKFYSLIHLNILSL